MRPNLSRLVPALLVAALVNACSSAETTKPVDPAAVERAMGRAPSQPPSNVAELFDRLAPETAPAPGTTGSRAVDVVRRAERPVAESLELQRVESVQPANPADQSTNPADGVLGRWDSPSQQQRFEDIPELRALPAPSEEIPHVRIGWYINASVDAFLAAIMQDKPLVLVLGDTHCARYCMMLIQRALRCPAVNRFAGEAVFAYGMPSRDKGALAFERSFDITAAPTITVLEPEARLLLERGRINGFFDAAKLGEHLETILWRTAPRAFEEEPPRLKMPTVAAPTTSSAEASAQQLKLALPLPECR